MNHDLMIKLLYANLRANREMTLTVTGVSMNPTMHEGDHVTVCRADSYAVGEVLVFLYKGELLIHRLIKIENNRYFCKGDNAFRLEDVTFGEIAGKVIQLNNTSLPPMPAPRRADIARATSRPARLRISLPP